MMMLPRQRLSALRLSLALRLGLCLGMSLGMSLSTAANAAPNKSFRFAIVPYGSHANEDQWQQRLQAIDEDSAPAFILVHSIKSKAEACSDAVYLQRKYVLDQLEHSSIVSIAEQDWGSCRGMTAGQSESNALEKLSRLREIFFSDQFSLGTQKFELVRLSRNPKFRNYPENARWGHGSVLFATLHLPANNNRYRVEAGRNSEFEDRQVANRDWLKKLFSQAKLRKTQALVLFSDGNLMGPNYAKSGKLRSAGSERQQDGFVDLQRTLLKFADAYNGKVLLIDNAASNEATSAIQWRGKIGTLSLESSTQASYIVTVAGGNQPVFKLTKLKD